MAAKYDAGLEPAPHDFPEVAHGQQGLSGHQHAYQQPYQQQPYQQPYPQPYQHQQPYYQQRPFASSVSPKPDDNAAPSTYGSQATSSPFISHRQPAAAQPPAKPSTTARTICGCSLLVFILSCIIALLAAGVIGLAAATGVESQRASSAEGSLAALRASATATATTSGTTAPTTTSTATSLGVIDDGCSDNPAGVDRTLYTSFSLLGGLKFTRYCNKDAPNPPLLSLFTANFGTCMDACAAYTKYVTPASSGSSSSSSSSSGGGGGGGNATTCEAVSFIPAWTSKTTAEAGGAPGNCYLKGGPQNESALTTPNIGVDCHAAILTPGA